MTERSADGGGLLAVLPLLSSIFAVLDTVDEVDTSAPSIVHGHWPRVDDVSMM